MIDELYLIFTIKDVILDIEHLLKDVMLVLYIRTSIVILK